MLRAEKFFYFWQAVPQLVSDACPSPCLIRSNARLIFAMRKASELILRRFAQPYTCKVPIDLLQIHVDGHVAEQLTIEEALQQGRRSTLNKRKVQKAEAVFALIRKCTYMCVF